MTPDESPGPDLFSPIFASAGISRLFGGRGMLQAMLDFEAALARAQAASRLFSAETAKAISQQCDADYYDIYALSRAARDGGNPAIPLVKALTAQVPKGAAGWVHWGATSQDVIDTAFMLRAKAALRLILRDVAAATEAAIDLAATHAGTVMAGRTLMQQAVPVTFGFKAAGWTAGLLAALVTLRRCLEDDIALQFGGAAGTLASLGGKGLEIRARLAAELDLPEPDISWHSERSRFVAIVAALAAASAAFAKIATDIMLMMQSEVAEAFEPAAAGRGGSSTMPHKRNPVACAAIRANHRRLAGLQATMLMAAEQEHERAAGGWGAEWCTIADIFALAGGSAGHLAALLAGLEIDATRMRANLDAAGGLPLAESLMMALAPHVGRMQAHHSVEATVRKAAANDESLADAAKADPAIAAHLSADEIVAALDPQAYLGTADDMIGRVIAEARKQLDEVKWSDDADD